MKRKRRAKGSESVKKEQKRLRTSGLEYKTYRGDIKPARTPLQNVNFVLYRFIEVRLFIIFIFRLIAAVNFNASPYPYNKYRVCLMIFIKYLII